MELEPSLVDTLIAAFLVAVPAYALAGWAWFKAHAKVTPAKWDDNVVRFIMQIANDMQTSQNTAKMEKKDVVAKN